MQAGSREGLTFRGSILGQAGYGLEISPGDDLDFEFQPVWFNSGGGAPSLPVAGGTISVASTAQEGTRGVTFVTPSGRSNTLPLLIRRAKAEILGLWPRVVWPGRIYTSADSSPFEFYEFKLVGTGLAGVSGGGAEGLSLTPYPKVTPPGTFLGSPRADQLSGFLWVDAKAELGKRSVRLQSPGGESNEAEVLVTEAPAEAPELLSVTRDDPHLRSLGRLVFRDADGDMASTTTVHGARVWVMAVHPPEAVGWTRASVPVHQPGVKEGTIDLDPSFNNWIRPIVHRDLRMAFWLEDAAGNLSNAIVVPMPSWP